MLHSTRKVKGEKLIKCRILSPKGVHILRPITGEYAVNLHVNEKLKLLITCDYSGFLGFPHVTTGFYFVLFFYYFQRDGKGGRNRRETSMHK